MIGLLNLKTNKMSTKIDHNKDSIKDVLSFDDKDMEQITLKLAKLSQSILIGEISQGKLCEDIAKTFSYNELLFVATMFVTDKTSMILEQAPELMAMIKFREMFNKFKEEE